MRVNALIFGDIYLWYLYTTSAPYLLIAVFYHKMNFGWFKLKYTVKRRIWFRICSNELKNKEINVKRLKFKLKMLKIASSPKYFIFSILVKKFFFKIHIRMTLKCGSTTGLIVFILHDVKCHIFIFILKIKVIGN